ncbi:hypothetical protein M8J77_008369 [Diaphorina citri]|nr:hypothetical protein M8J77_008369 [Diaphorina citri]
MKLNILRKHCAQPLPCPPIVFNVTWLQCTSLSKEEALNCCNCYGKQRNCCSRNFESRSAVKTLRIQAVSCMMGRFSRFVSGGPWKIIKLEPNSSFSSNILVIYAGSTLA